jgi:uncharacterized protein YuzE
MEDQAMKLTYDSAADAVYVSVASGTVSWTEPLDDGRTVDHDAAGKILGFEFLGVSEGIATEGIPVEVVQLIEANLPHARLVLQTIDEGRAAR